MKKRKKRNKIKLSAHETQTMLFEISSTFIMSFKELGLSDSGSTHRDPGPIHSRGNLFFWQNKIGTSVHVLFPLLMLLLLLLLLLLSQPPFSSFLLLFISSVFILLLLLSLSQLSSLLLLLLFPHENELSACDSSQCESLFCSFRFLLFCSF